MNKEALQQFITLTENKTSCNLSGVIGLDGFIDNIMDVVEKRYNDHDYLAFQEISSYKDRIAGAIGKSVNIELVTKQVKIGGNGPIMAKSMGSLGMKGYYIGALGQKALDPVFAPLQDNFQIYSFADPGITDALEFNDGKILQGKLDSLKTITWDNMQKTIGKEKLEAIILEADFLSFVNWTMLPFMNEIWLELYKILKNSNKRKYCFIDLADFEKRTTEDVTSAFEILTQLNEVCDVILGLNHKEAQQAALLFDKEFPNNDKESVQELTSFLQQQLKLHTVAVHPREFACAANDNGVYYAQGPFSENPLISTGAGDHFNAGFFSGLLLDLPCNYALYLGVLNSGYYVRTGISPSVQQLVEFAKLCLEDKANKVM